MRMLGYGELPPPLMSLLMPSTHRRFAASTMRAMLGMYSFSSRYSGMIGIVARDALDRRDQVVQAVLGNDRGDLGADAAVARRFMHDHQPAGLRHRIQDRLGVDRD